MRGLVVGFCLAVVVSGFGAAGVGAQGAPVSPDRLVAALQAAPLGPVATVRDEARPTVTTVTSESGWMLPGALAAVIDTFTDGGYGNPRWKTANDFVAFDVYTDATAAGTCFAQVVPYDRPHDAAAYTTVPGVPGSVYVELLYGSWFLSTTVVDNVIIQVRTTYYGNNGLAVRDAAVLLAAAVPHLHTRPK